MKVMIEIVLTKSRQVLHPVLLHLCAGLGEELKATGKKD